jgi:hypothetical protein
MMRKANVIACRRSFGFCVPTTRFASCHFVIFWRIPARDYPLKRDVNTKI